jgi:DNA-binding CsgD family transcriptional regulator
MEILRAVGEGSDNATIGERLFISRRTVEKHVENIQMKTGIRTRSQLVAFASRLDLSASEDLAAAPESTSSEYGARMPNLRAPRAGREPRDHP